MRVGVGRVERAGIPVHHTGKRKKLHDEKDVLILRLGLGFGFTVQGSGFRGQDWAKG